MKIRLEKIDVRRTASQAKIWGTILSVSGAIIVTLHKGHVLINSQQNPSIHQLTILSPKSNWVIGGAFLAVYSLLIPIWFILQANILKEYPEELNASFFFFVFATLHSAIFTFITQTASVWRLRHGIEYIAVVYTGVVGSVFTVIVHTWYLHRKGPIYVSIFKPFGIVVAVILSVMFLGDTLYVGSVIGSIIVSAGFYGVLWGKSKDGKMKDDIDDTSTLEHSPLLGSSR